MQKFDTVQFCLHVHMKKHVEISTVNIILHNLRIKILEATGLNQIE